jgi:hypothetical protein
MPMQLHLQGHQHGRQILGAAQNFRGEFFFFPADECHSRTRGTYSSELLNDPVAPAQWIWNVLFSPQLHCNRPQGFQFWYYWPPMKLPKFVKFGNWFLVGYTTFSPPFNEIRAMTQL